MESPRRPRYQIVLASVALVLVGFVGGQIAPTVIPASWKIATSSNRLDFGSLQSLHEVLQRKFDGDLDNAKVMDGARAGLVSGAGDPYTTYLTAKEAQALNDQLSGTLSGIGAEVATKNGKLTVVAPIEGSPAQQAGLQAGDVILKINDTDSSTLTLDEAVSKIRGDKGTKVTLKVVRGSSDPKDITITRDVISVPSVKWSMKEGNIGYIQITQFGNDTSSKAQQAANELKSQGAQKILVDLRNNPGGFLDSAVSVAGNLLPSGKTVVQEKTRGKVHDSLTTSGQGQLAGLPMVVLINEGSASASEILAGALSDNKAATLIGVKSFGKGSVQEVVKLDGGAELKVTVAHWFTPSGKGIDKQGIKPDVEVKQTQDDFNAGRDPQLDRALLLLRSGQ